MQPPPAGPPVHRLEVALAGLLVLCGLGLFLDSGVERIRADAAIAVFPDAGRRLAAIWSDDADLERALTNLQPALDEVRRRHADRVVIFTPPNANLIVSRARHALFPAQVLLHDLYHDPVPPGGFAEAARRAGADEAINLVPPFGWRVLPPLRAAEGGTPR